MLAATDPAFILVPALSFSADWSQPHHSGDRVLPWALQHYLNDSHCLKLKISQTVSFLLSLFFLSNFPGDYISTFLSLPQMRQPWQRLRYLKLLQKLALPKKKFLFLGFTGFQVEGALVPSCGTILERGKTAMWGRVAGLWVTELWPLGAAFPCAGVHKAGHVCTPPRLLQSHAPVYHRPA